MFLARALPAQIRSFLARVIGRGTVRVDGVWSGVGSGRGCSIGLRGRGGLLLGEPIVPLPRRRPSEGRDPRLGESPHGARGMLPDHRLVAFHGLLEARAAAEIFPRLRQAEGRPFDDQR
ncbi:MAG: hypothetical protein ACKON7_02485, partial [Planctomycetaceae bacterium]